MQLSERFEDRIAGTFGLKGKRWLHQLPYILDDLSHRWSLTLLPAADNLSYNYVTTAVREDGTRVVLKAGVPNKELITEIEALRMMDGIGAVQIIDSDPGMGALLLEQLKPGLPIFELEDDEAATAIAAQVMQKLWRAVPAGHPFPMVSDWAKGFKRLRDRFDGGTGPFPEELVEKAESLYGELLRSSSGDVLLHGDLHHWNILSAEREPWLAIDPKGVIGEPAYEIGAWLRNPFPEILKLDDFQQVTERRVSQFSEILCMDKTRLRRWGFAQAVLSGWWSFEDNTLQWEAWINLARSLAELL